MTSEQTACIIKKLVEDWKALDRCLRLESERADIRDTFWTESSPVAWKGVKEAGVLYKTKAYLAGPMQYTEDGQSWRDDMSAFLERRGITAFDPNKNTFIEDKQETNDKCGLWAKYIEEERYDELAAMVKQTRNLDLRLTDIVDFLIVYVNPEMYTVGTWEELFQSNRSKKPIFVVIEGGKKNCPLWLFGTLPHKYFYESFDALKETLSKINSGEKELDSDRWRLLKPELR